jgi:hypothetical protein
VLDRRWRGLTRPPRRFFRPSQAGFIFRSKVLIGTSQPGKRRAANFLEFASRSIRPRTFSCAAFFAAVALSVFAPRAKAQVRANIAGVNLSAIMGDSISVSASPGLVNFTLTSNGVSNGSSTVTITTAWVLARPVTISTYGYFSNSTSALTDGAGHNIPTSSVLGNINGGGFQGFTGACPFSGNTCIRIWRQRVRRGRRRVNGLIGTHNDTMQLQISTVGLSLAAGTYTGVLHIRAQAL